MLLALKLKVLATAALVAAPAAVSPLLPAPAAAPEMIELPAAALRYRMAGDFTRAGAPATAPLITVEIPRSLPIMRHQVTAGDYRRCVEAGACSPSAGQAGADYPVVKVSWRDAQAYAAWLSRSTGLRYRLPTDAEWAYAAGRLFVDDALPEGAAANDPGRRALARYDREAELEPADKEPKPIGSLGLNENGLADLAGNVWEWTASCFERGVLDPGGTARVTTVNCGVRVVEGRHRAYVTDFVRDARAGGCAAGTPPSNLGFRLVQEPEGIWPGLRRLMARLQD